jgi:hypothetical protein
MITDERLRPDGEKGAFFMHLDGRMTCGCNTDQTFAKDLCLVFIQNDGQTGYDVVYWR